MVMAGGTHLDRDLDDTWVYDCKTRRWQRRAAAPEALEWPGMCYDSKRGVVLYAALKATYAYDAARDQWSKIGAAVPKYDTNSCYCDMAYDEARDVYVLTVVRGDGETVYLMAPAGPGAPVATAPAPREQADDAPFPPPADPAALERIRTMPTNTWVKVTTDVTIGNRGLRWLEVSVKGRASHAGRPHVGANAIHAAARTIGELERLPAARVRYGEDVYLEKTCPQHGAFRTIIWRGQPEPAVTRPQS
jgi:hypothetical protein